MEIAQCSCFNVQMDMERTENVLLAFFCLRSELTFLYLLCLDALFYCAHFHYLFLLFH